MGWIPKQIVIRREADRRTGSASRVSGIAAAPRTAAGLLAGIVVVVLAGASPAHAAQPGFAFLDIPTGARAAAMGGAYASVGHGIEAVYWNPAGLSEARGFQVIGGHGELLERLRLDHFAIGGRAWGGGIAASVRALYSDPIEERDELGNLIGTFGAHDLEFALGYGRPIGGGVSIGGTAQVIRERIANLAATTYGFGFGAAFEPSTWPGVTLGITAQNLGPSAHYTIDGSAGAPVDLPAALQAGASYTVGVGGRYRLQTALESRVVRGRTAMGFVGTELADPRGAALRVGMRFNDSSTAVGFGAGYALSALTVDYAFVPLRDDLGNTHRIAFTAQF